MADQDTPPTGAGEAATNGQGPAVALQTVYIKDLSFEAPKGPYLPAQTQDPKISLNLSTMSNTVGQDAHEVVLSVTIEAKAGDVAVSPAGGEVRRRQRRVRRVGRREEGGQVRRRCEAGWLVREARCGDAREETLREASSTGFTPIVLAGRHGAPGVRPALFLCADAPLAPFLSRWVRFVAARARR